jgi:Domain of unknown function (DUF5668)/N-terminal domain of toast_rack, DUF2154
MGRYRSLALPGLLILIGGFALAANLNLVRWDSLYRLVDLWPAILILIGVELVLRGVTSPRAASAIGLVLVVLTVIAAVAYVAVAPPLPGGSETLDTSAAVSGLEKASLDLSFGAAEVTVHGEALGDTLYKAHLEYAGPKPEVSLDRSSGTLTVQQAGQGFPFLFGPRGRRVIDLALNDSVPWSVSVAGGASHATLSLGSLRVTSLDLSGGANNVAITLGKPSGTVTVDISGGASSVTLHRPAGVAASVSASGGANSVRLDDQHLPSFGDGSAQTPGYDSAADRYQVDVSGGASNVSIVSP